MEKAAIQFTLAGRIVGVCFVVVVICSGVVRAENFVHPGCLSTQPDLDRMAKKVAAAAEPWKGSWDILVRNTDNFLDDGPGVQPRMNAGRSDQSENFIRLARDCAKAYQCAVRYYGSRDTRFAEKSVQLMNAWAVGHTGWGGDTNIYLRAGLYGYQFACAAELMRDYKGWKREDFAAFQKYMVKMFYNANHDFLVRHNGTVNGHYWANWDLASMTSIIAIGVLCDDRSKFDEAVKYFNSGVGNGSIRNAVPFVHPDGLGQWQESGRDQGHSLMGPQLMGAFCEIAWNQGVDLYGAMDNRFLAGVEYISKYNLGEDVPFVTYVWRHAHPGKQEEWVQTGISDHGRDASRPGWDLVYNHYVNRMGYAAPFTAAFARRSRPEGGGFNYGGNSGGFDSLGFTTLTHSRDPIAKAALPSAPRPTVVGRQITLAWNGSAYATSYNVKRATERSGPFTKLATVAGDYLSYTDTGLKPNTKYFYAISAIDADGESADGPLVAVSTDLQLQGTIIGTDGSWKNSGAEKRCVFDGSLDDYFDSPDSVGWVGLDLGDGVSATITAVRYCAREASGKRMVGGEFQGSDSADFSGNVVTLCRINTPPPDGKLTEQRVSNAKAFRYLRYLSAEGGNCCVAELQFMGLSSGLNAPAVPQNAAAESKRTGQIDLTWDAVRGATSYTIHRATTGNSFVIVGNTPDVTFHDANLTANAAYRYSVTALNAAGESAASAEIEKTAAAAADRQ